MKFKTLDEGIDYIINSLTQSEKNLIKNTDPAGAHMALSQWANSEYVLNSNYNIKELLLGRLDAEGSSFIHNDNVVGVLIDGIIEKLKVQ